MAVDKMRRVLRITTRSCELHRHLPPIAAAFEARCTDCNRSAKASDPPLHSPAALALSPRHSAQPRAPPAAPRPAAPPPPAGGEGGATHGRATAGITRFCSVLLRS